MIGLLMNIGLSLKLKGHRTPPVEIVDKPLCLHAKMRGRKADRQLHAHEAAAVLSHRFDLMRDGKKRQNEEAFILRLISAVGDPLIGQCVILPPIGQCVRSEAGRVALDKPGGKRRRMDGFDLFVPVIDSN